MRKFMNNLPPDKKNLAKKILQLFYVNNINAMFMKLYSNDDDLDTVIIEKDQYLKAVALLKSNQWHLKNNKSKLRERDKDFFHHKDSPYVVHLHQSFSWNTVAYLNSRLLWERKKVIEGLAIPSTEDELLIVGAHSIFENQCIKAEEIKYGRILLENNIDYKYMQEHAETFHWKKGLDMILDKLRENEPSLSILDLITAKAEKLGKDIKSGLTIECATEAFNYLFIDWIWNYRIMLLEKLKRRPIIITVSGVDGSGKSTVVKAIYRMSIDNGKRTKIFHSGNTPLIKNAKQASSLPGAGCLIFIKDLLQILWDIFSHKSYDVLIFDRYIYDTLIKISHKQKKKALSKPLITVIGKITPKPDLAFLLETSPAVSHKRDQDHSMEYHELKHTMYHSLLSHFPNMQSIQTTVSKKDVISITEEKTKPFLIAAKH